MNKKIIFLILITLLNGCSLNKNSRFWTESENIPKENSLNFKEIFIEESALGQEFNKDKMIALGSTTNNNFKEKIFFNNDGMYNYNGELKKSSRYKFPQIKNFNQFEPSIVFHDKNIIFFDNKGSILKFDENSNLIWKQNYYSKSEIKLKPILQFINNDKILIIVDNIAKYYALNLSNGELLWSENNLAPFNSQVKIFKDKFLVADFSNTLRCFSIINGKELWNIKTESSLIRSQKKLSMVIVDDLLYFNNSIGDISAIDINKGELLWQLPTQSSLIYEAAFSLETSDIITDGDTLFFSNNKNQFFSIDLGSGSFNWENKVNSNLRPTLIGNYLFTVSIEGYLIIIDKNNGNILRATDVFENFKKKMRDKIKPTGFIVGKKNVYLSTDKGRLLVIDIYTGKTTSILKIDNNKISRPFVLDKSLFVIKNNAIIKLN